MYLCAPQRKIVTSQSVLYAHVVHEIIKSRLKGLKLVDELNVGNLTNDCLRIESTRWRFDLGYLLHGIKSGEHGTSILSGRQSTTHQQFIQICTEFLPTFDPKDETTVITMAIRCYSISRRRQYACLTCDLTCVCRGINP